MTEKDAEKIIKLYNKYGAAAPIQNHFPTLSVRTIQRRVKALKEQGRL